MVVRDRLPEIYEANSSRVPAELNVTDLDNNNNNGKRNDDPFLEQINRIRCSLEDIYGRIQMMVQVQEAILAQTIVRPEDTSELDKLIEQIRDRTSAVRANVHSLEEGLMAEKEREARSGGGGGQRIGEATKRIRQNQADQMRRLLNEVLGTFHSVQEEYRQRVARRVRRQLELAGEHLGTGEVEHLLEQKSDQIFYRHISLMSIAAQTALDDASSRHSELLRLEQSIAELTECVQDMFTLVHSQAELVDRIETNVSAAAEYSGKGRVQIRQAVTYKKSSQRVKCLLVLLLTAVMLLLFLVLAIVLARFMPNLGSH